MYVVETCFDDEDNYIPICFKSDQDALKRAKAEIKKQFKSCLADYNEDQLSIKSYPKGLTDENVIDGYAIVFKDNAINRTVVIDFAVVKHFKVK